MVYTTTVVVEIEIYSAVEAEVTLHSKAEVTIDVHTGSHAVEGEGG